MKATDPAQEQGVNRRDRVEDARSRIEIAVAQDQNCTDARPLPRQAVAEQPDGLEAYRLESAPEVAALLLHLVQADTPLNLNSPRGGVYTTTLWSADARRGVLSFAGDARDPRLQALLDEDEAVVVGYLDDIKIQFDVDNLVLVRGERASALNTNYPHALFRFQRRNGFRVKPILRETPVARLHHPLIPELRLALRILDVSFGGCALLLPEDVPALAPGALIDPVQIELDTQTRFETTLRLQHVSSIHSDARGTRLGCEMWRLGREDERTLQRYIDQTQKRRRVLALD